MNADVLSMRRFDANDQAIDIALPVLAIECEATPPMENFLDAYEEAVLKLVSLGLSTGGISKTLNATESLVEEILTHLEAKEYVHREIGRPWELTENGEGYLNGGIRERASADSQYGYMFVNAIKKEILPYFHQGDVGTISLFRGEHLPLKLTAEGGEAQTFAPVEIKHARLKKAYRAYFRNLKVVDDYLESAIPKEEAFDLFFDLESFDEEEDEVIERYFQENKAGRLPQNMFIRALRGKPKNLYFRMRIIIDPSYPGGYRAESPFDFYGVDDNYFLRQIQWLEQSEKAYLDNELMQDFLHREICKLSPSYTNALKDYGVFVLERMPLLSIYRSRFPYVYEDMEKIYGLMQRQRSLLEKENIVNNLARCVVEALFNIYFRSVDQSRLEQIRQKALDDVKIYGCEEYKQRICVNARLSDDTLRWVNRKYLNTILNRINMTYGNSILEKFINMLVIDYHLSDAQLHRFLTQKDIQRKYILIDKLNRIRRKVSHDTGDRFVNEDYDFYMENVFELVNGLLEGFRGDE